MIIETRDASPMPVASHPHTPSMTPGMLFVASAPSYSLVPVWETLSYNSQRMLLAHSFFICKRFDFRPHDMLKHEDVRDVGP